MVTTIHTFIVTMCHLNSKILNIYLIVHLIVQMQSSFNIFEINHNKIIFKTKLNTRAPSQSFCQKNNVERLVKKKKGSRPMLLWIIILAVYLTKIWYQFSEKSHTCQILTFIFNSLQSLQGCYRYPHSAVQKYQLLF